MKIIGQNINIFDPRVYKAVNRKDAAFIRFITKELIKNGADGLEINLGGWRASDQVMPWMVKKVRKETDCPLFLSPIPASLKEAVEADQTGRIFINCVTADKDRLKSMLNAALCLKTSLVVLLTRKGCCPSGLDEMLLLAEEVIETAERANFPLERLVLDPVLRPRLTTDASGSLVNRPDATFFAEAIVLMKMLRTERPIKTAAGINNLTVGMDRRKRENFEPAAIRLLQGAGLDYLIMDCSNRQLLERIRNEGDYRCLSLVKSDMANRLDVTL